MPAVTSGVPRTSQSVVDLIGNTPLIRLSGFETGLRNVELWAKAEWRNPGGSVKDRPAARMILDGERSGKLTRDKIILDATSGNTGIAYAMIGAARGYRVRLCVPANVTPERKRILAAYGADIVFTDPMEGSDGAILRAKAMFAAEPDRVLLSGPVQQSRQLVVALRYDGARDHRADRRPIDALRGRTRYQRHVCRRWQTAARGQSGDPSDFRSARLAAPRAGRSEAHGDGDCAGDLRRAARRRRHRRQHRGGVRADKGACAIRRVRRHFERRQSRGRAAGRLGVRPMPSSSSCSATVAKNICQNVCGMKADGP